MFSTLFRKFLRQRITYGLALTCQLSIVGLVGCGSVAVPTSPPITDQSGNLSSSNSGEPVVPRPEPSSEPSAMPSASPSAEPTTEPSAAASASPQPTTVPTTGPVTDINDYRDNFFRNYATNPFVEAVTDPLSTFAADIDNASYTLTRAYLQQNTLPPQAAIRPEEFVNAFDYQYPQPLNDTFAIHTELAPSYFGDSYTKMLRIGLQGKEILDRNRKPAKLTFVIDVSGSMNTDNRLALAQQSLNLLLQQLKASDEIALVIYGSTARTVLPHTPVSQKSRIESAINSLRPEGATNAEAGLTLAYQEANKAFDPNAINRIILCSDGVANVGETGPEAILQTIKNESQRISLSTLGFGMNGFNDALMEQLANQGDGQYAYIDTLEEARKLFVEKLTSTLQTIARNVKIQVMFNTQNVAQYRLIGYENRNVADDDFRNDAVDAGEVGSNHSVTALYEVRLTPEATAENPLATVFLRYEDVEDNFTVKEQSKTVLAGELKAFSNSSPSFQLSVAVAEFAELLRGSIFAQDGSLTDVQSLLGQLQGKTPDPQALNELLNLIQRTENLRNPTAAKPLETLVNESDNPRQLKDWNTFLLKQLGGLPPGQ